MAAGTHRRSAALPSFVSIGAAAAAAESLFLHQPRSTLKTAIALYQRCAHLTCAGQGRGRLGRKRVKDIHRDPCWF